MRCPRAECYACNNFRHITRKRSELLVEQMAAPQLQCQVSGVERFVFRNCPMCTRFLQNARSGNAGAGEQKRE